MRDRGYPVALPLLDSNRSDSMLAPKILPFCCLEQLEIARECPTQKKEKKTLLTKTHTLEVWSVALPIPGLLTPDVVCLKVL